jgi:hypothetical protein
MSVTIKDITIPALNKPPHFAPKYCHGTMKFYSDVFCKDQAVDHLMSKVSNYDNIDFNLMRLDTIEDQQIKNLVKRDLLETLEDAIIETFYKNPTLEEVTAPGYDLNFDEENDRYVEDGLYDEVAEKKLEIVLSKRIRDLVFKRTANTCTRWGFI